MAYSLEEIESVNEEIFKRYFVRSSVLIDPKLDVKPSYIGRQLEYQIEGYIWSQEAEKIEVKVDYPSDWWQAFKEYWFPKIFARWIVDRYPVKYTRIRKALVADALYPGLKIIPEAGSPLLKLKILDMNSWVETKPSRQLR